jgi:exopolysaccharide production protein ExoQ
MRDPLSNTASCLTLVQSSDRTRQIMLLPGVIGFYFSFRLFIVILTVRLFQSDAQVGTLAGLALNFILLAVVAFHSMGPAPTTLRSTLEVKCVRWVLIFLGFSLLSLLWTAAASISAALAFWCAMAADVAMVVLLLRDGSEDAVTAALLKGYVCGACAIAAMAWMLPAQSDLRLGDEGLLGPNQIGYACAFAVFMAQYLIHQSFLQWKIPAVFLAITMVRSFSKTTLVAFLVSEIFILIYDTSIKRKSKVIIALAACLTIAAFWGLIDAYLEVYTNTGNQAETLTGRLGIWAYILDKAIEQPWIGHGFHSVWKVIPPFGDFEARHAHNEILQQFYAYGTVGVFMLMGLYGSFFRQIRKLSRGPGRTFLIGLTLFILIRGLADTEAFDLSLPLWTIALISLTLARSRTDEVPA